MLNRERLDQMKADLAKVSPAPWSWTSALKEEPTDDPVMLAAGVDTLPDHEHIQLLSKGEHRFWVEMTDTRLAGDVVFDFIKNARQWVPELIAEVERLRKMLNLDH